MKKIWFGTLILFGILLVGCTSNQNTLPSTSSNLKSEASVANSSSNGESDSTLASTSLPEKAITLAEALAIFEKEYPDLTITSIDLDTSYGSYRYKFNGVSDNEEFEVKIDAQSGKITQSERENLDSDETNGIAKAKDGLDLTNLLSIGAVSEIAVKAAGAGEAVEWSLDKDNGVMLWEVSVKNGRSETSVKINNQTSEVLEIELDD
ncbi:MULTISPECIES: PepSY domain-containing protein [unclassified Enterococcus]|uniref:PepSY domain-containing protein n=1 Tax=unclassified Enterococcus TaxID=2608891 RepID=UPI001552EEF1|nr:MULTISPECIES: PepSY domain-containing protein [unclassified Enterococcus]MBS7577380.1 PepSY domain-containing protein [Enterococcus sp. MMGLQ5-2]MBS7584787.1 PepSY domain-containing protein [Enterococcus sp. MMGLQ5-1]NPD12642.1 lysis protein [Enterococcus sp. MMGLQ5-1]NPD37214.1 lysis protein [Enterococcus sp. MMGLQ5-2]